MDPAKCIPIFVTDGASYCILSGISNLVRLNDVLSGIGDWYYKVQENEYNRYRRYCVVLLVFSL